MLKFYCMAFQVVKTIMESKKSKNQQEQYPGCFEKFYLAFHCSETQFSDSVAEQFFTVDFPFGQFGGKVHRIKGNLIHLMRGQVFTIEGTKIFTMGGGESPDLESRIEDNPWLKHEIPSKEELLEGATNLENHDCKIDVILTHEPSSTIKSFLTLGESDSVRVTTLNAYFDELSKCSEFSRWFFGSLHLDKYISNTYIGVHKGIVNAHTGERVKF